MENRIAQLRADLEAIDGAIPVFDPSLAPQTIRPKIKRKPPAHFRHGQFTRTVLDLLRRASAPMKAGTIAEQIAQDYRLDAGTTEATNKLVSKVRNGLANHKGVLSSERNGEAVLWSVK